MADGDDRHRVKRAEVAATHTKRPWNTDLPSSHHIISALVALSQTVYSLDCDWKLATACLLSDIFFNKLAKSYYITINSLQQKQRDFRNKYAPYRFKPGDQQRPTPFPVVNPHSLILQDNPYKLEPFPPTTMPNIEKMKEFKRLYDAEVRDFNKAEFYYLLLCVAAKFCPPGLGRELSKSMSINPKQRDELASVYVDRCEQLNEVYYMCAALNVCRVTSTCTCTCTR